LSGGRRYAVVVENAGRDLAAYVPDLPGCVVTGRDVAELVTAIEEAIAFHLDGLREDGLPAPDPTRPPDILFESET
jgi:predicted RNase H-like HicB family nuclease